MNRKYHNEFKGIDGALNRIDILSKNEQIDQLVKTTGTPFLLQYQDTNKLTPIQGAQATIELVSETNFQFKDLHTDDMQGYMVSLYRNNKIFWHGWLDSELYNETLSSFHPYPVEFTAADFNILERIKYTDDKGNKYDDIASMITHINRCLDNLGLPFSKLYIGCDTILEGVTMSDQETALHKSFIMSSNFYDEDGVSMSCREILESIFQPFGLMMVQKNGNVYIYDYNTVKRGLPMKRYDFKTYAFEANENVDFFYGNILDVGLMSKNGDYGFEEMINNVKITSSLYGDSSLVDIDVSENSLSDLIDSYLGRDFKLYYYSKCVGVENLSGKFAIYKRDYESDIEGALLDYDPNPSNIYPIYRIRYPNYILGSDTLCFINLILQAYVNTRENPFNEDSGVKDNPNSGTMKLYCNLYMTDSSGKPLRYLDLINDNGSFWVDVSNGVIEQGKCLLWISQESSITGSVLDTWVGNANIYDPMPTRFNIETIPSAGDGLDVPTNKSYGFLVFEITNKARVVNPKDDKGLGTDGLLDDSLVKNILINNIFMKIITENKEDVSVDDYEFKSYINKKVANDFNDITLKCISANEDGIPIGKGNILKKEGDKYTLQTSFTRSNQTDILERLLMCTIHSNFSQKNERFSVTSKIAGNPMLSYITYYPVLSGEYIVAGCTIDFNKGSVNISAVGYSDDTAKLSDIPYD